MESHDEDGHHGIGITTGHAVVSIAEDIIIMLGSGIVLDNLYAQKETES